MSSAASLVHPKYRPDIDGLRAIAILSVVWYHAFPGGMRGGFIGVDIFFVISGFLISTIIFENLGKGTFSFAGFYARRIRRIFPALLVVLSSCLAFGWIALLADELSQLGWHTFAGAGFFNNFVLWNEVRYFDNSADTKPLLHLWSLAIEEQFYLFWPPLVWLIWRWKRLLVPIMIALIAASFFLNVSTVFSDPTAAFYSPLTRLWELLCGALLGWFFLGRSGEPEHVPARAVSGGAGLRDKTRLIANALSFGGLLLLAAGVFLTDKRHAFPGYWVLLPVIGTMLLISAGPSAWINRRILSSRVMVWFGLISFPLYLWHWPILSFGRIAFMETPTPTYRVLAVALSILLSWLTVKFVERPIRFSPRKSELKVALSACSILLVGVLGLWASKTDFSASHTVENLIIPRPDHGIGSSIAWYRGQDDWLFLGNEHDASVAKLKLAMVPTEDQLDATYGTFSQVTAEAAKSGTAVALLIGPNKESIYPEFLPASLTPSPTKYSSFFFDRLRSVPGLTFYDPTADLLRLKADEGILYWRTDTHWNNKGAFLSLRGILTALDLPVPQVEFEAGELHAGDLTIIAQMDDFPLHPGDNWQPVWPQPPSWRATPAAHSAHPSFTEELVRNDDALSDKTVWVVGDSFTSVLRPYLNATFKEVNYVGHWSNALGKLPTLLRAADDKPDLIFVVMVERSF